MKPLNVIFCFILASHLSGCFLKKVVEAFTAHTNEALLIAQAQEAIIRAKNALELAVDHRLLSSTAEWPQLQDTLSIFVSNQSAPNSSSQHKLQLASVIAQVKMISDELDFYDNIFPGDFTNKFDVIAAFLDDAIATEEQRVDYEKKIRIQMIKNAAVDEVKTTAERMLAQAQLVQWGPKQVQVDQLIGKMENLLSQMKVEPDSPVVEPLFKEMLHLNRLISFYPEAEGFNWKQPDAVTLNATVEAVWQVVHRSRKIYWAADSYQRAFLPLFGKIDNLDSYLDGLNVSINPVLLDRRLNELATEGAALENELTLFGEIFRNEPSSGNWRRYLLLLRYTAEEMGKMTEENSEKSIKSLKQLEMKQITEQIAQNLKSISIGHFDYLQVGVVVKDLERLKAKIGFLGLEMVGKEMKEAALQIIRAKATLEEADDYQRDLFTYANQWPKLEGLLRLETKSDKVEEEIFNLTKRISNEITLFDGLFRHGRQADDWKVYLDKLARTGLELARAAKGSGNWSEKAGESKKIVEEIEKRSSQLSALKSWSPVVVNAFFLELTQVNEQISFFQESLSVEKEALLSEDSLERAQIALIRYDRAIREADLFQRDFLRFGAYPDLNDQVSIFKESSRNPIENQFQRERVDEYTDKLNDEVSFFEAFFEVNEKSGQMVLGDEQMYFKRLKATAEEMVKKASKWNGLSNGETVEHLLRDLGDIEGDKWRTFSCVNLFNQMRYLNRKIHFYPVKEYASFNLM